MLYNCKIIFDWKKFSVSKGTLFSREKCVEFFQNVFCTILERYGRHREGLCRLWLVHLLQHLHDEAADDVTLEGQLVRKKVNGWDQCLPARGMIRHKKWASLNLNPVGGLVQPSGAAARSAVWKREQRTSKYAMQNMQIMQIIRNSKLYKSYFVCKMQKCIFQGIAWCKKMQIMWHAYLPL